MNKKLYKLMNWPEIEGIVYSESDNPHAMLGAHVIGNSVLVQTFQPGAKEVRLQLLDGDKSYKMELADESGYFAVLLPGKFLSGPLPVKLQLRSVIPQNRKEYWKLPLPEILLPSVFPAVADVPGDFRYLSPSAGYTA